MSHYSVSTIEGLSLLRISRVEARFCRDFLARRCCLQETGGCFDHLMVQVSRLNRDSLLSRMGGRRTDRSKWNDPLGQCLDAASCQVQVSLLSFSEGLCHHLGKTSFSCPNAPRILSKCHFHKLPHNCPPQQCQLQLYLTINYPQGCLPGLSSAQSLLPSDIGTRRQGTGGH